MIIIGIIISLIILGLNAKFKFLHKELIAPISLIVVFTIILLLINKSNASKKSKVLTPDEAIQRVQDFLKTSRFQNSIDWTEQDDIYTEAKEYNWHGEIRRFFGIIGRLHKIAAADRGEKVNVIWDLDRDHHARLIGLPSADKRTDPFVGFHPFIKEYEMSEWGRKAPLVHIGYEKPLAKTEEKVKDNLGEKEGEEKE